MSITKKVNSEEKKGIKDNLWRKCENCDEISFVEEIKKHSETCPLCGFHFKVSAISRINIIVDKGSFVELDDNLIPLDPLKFRDSKKYTERLKAAQKKTGLSDSYISGQAKINDIDVNIGSLEFDFMAGSLGSVAGERITRMFEDAIDRGVHVITISTSGGARMQESILGLMQMAKTSSVIAKHSSKGLGHISILTDPTTGGVTASYAMLGDINIAEPGAMIAFAGPRVIQQTIQQTLPSGFQRSEFLLNHGILDKIVHRKDLRETITKILKFFG